jgi:hypothetical protein
MATRDGSQHAQDESNQHGLSAILDTQPADCDRPVSALGHSLRTNCRSPGRHPRTLTAAPVRVNHRDRADFRRRVRHFHASIVTDPKFMRTFPHLLHAVEMASPTFSTSALSERVARFIRKRSGGWKHADVKLGSAVPTLSKEQHCGSLRMATTLD